MTTALPRPIQCRQHSNSFTIRSNSNDSTGAPLSSSPPVSNLKTTYPFFLPPGISLPVKGSSLQDFRDDFESSASSSSRKSSSSTSSFSLRDRGRDNDSPPSSLASSADDISRAKYCLEVEDPDLAAARRALWEDAPVVASPGEVADVHASSGQVVGEEDTQQDGDGEDEDDEGDDELDVSSEGSLIVDLSPVPSPREPAHATLPPLPSCLRPRVPTRSPSNSSSVHSSISVRISVEPPVAAETYSPIDYKRGGEEPVEKLSIRDVVELMGVREAVGVWSGKIGKWEEGDECESPTSMATMESHQHYGSSQGSQSSTPTSPTHPPPPTRSCSVHVVGKPQMPLMESSL